MAGSGKGRAASSLSGYESVTSRTEYRSQRWSCYSLLFSSAGVNFRKLLPPKVSGSNPKVDFRMWALKSRENSTPALNFVRKMAVFSKLLANSLTVSE
eukprot:474648-Rhodomonas_salina.2